MLRKTLLVASVLLISYGLFAQSGALKGKVADIESGEAIPFANVIVELNGNLVGGGISDFDGNYTIKPIPPGKYTVKSSYVGYNSLEMTGVVLKADKFTFVDLKMTASTQELEVVQVIGYKVPLIDKDNTQTGGTVTSDDIAKMSNAKVKELIKKVDTEELAKVLKNAKDEVKDKIIPNMTKKAKTEYERIEKDIKSISKEDVKNFTNTIESEIKKLFKKK